jgi:peptidylprolyl isomerase
LDIINRNWHQTSIYWTCDLTPKCEENLYFPKPNINNLGVYFGLLYPWLTVRKGKFFLHEEKAVLAIVPRWLVLPDPNEENSVKINMRRSGWLLAASVTLLAIALAACQSSGNEPTGTASPTTVPDQATTGATLSAVEAAGITPYVVVTPAVTPTLFVLQGARTTSTGLQYLEESAGSGETPKAGDIVTMHYIASLLDGTELSNTYTFDEPINTVWGLNRLLPGWEEGLGMMKPGGKAKLVLPADLAFGVEGYGIIPPNSQIVMQVELLSVEPAPVPTEIASDQLTQSTSGLQYYEIIEGEGPESTQNSTVSTNYIIWVKTDQGYNFVDRSTAGSPLSFVLGRGDMVFPGWDEGATGMKVGGKRLLVIPPDLGLGSENNDIIPANSTLVMEIELTDVKEPQIATQVDEQDLTTTESGLKYYDLKTGTGDTPEAGQTVVVHYTGWLADGTQFDSSLDRGETFSFVLGAGNIIPGWDEGLTTMKVGGKRQLVIPPELGYGDQGAGSVIPPGATLIFEVELLEIK